MSIYNPFKSVRHDLVCEKIGFDWANKKMLVKVYDSLQYVIEFSGLKPTWTNIVRHMFQSNGDNINRIKVNGYYSTIRTILKDIKVIQYESVNGVRTYQLEKGPNWDRFFSDEDWSWFITDTSNGGTGTIVK